MGELLLELLSEEIPARMQRRAVEELGALVRDKLAAAEIAAQTLRGFVTPRRLTVIADGIPAQQRDRSDERRGPRVGAPQPALDGFLRAAGLDSIGQCEIRDTGRGEFYFVVIERPGRATAEVLPELLHAAIAEIREDPPELLRGDYVELLPEVLRDRSSDALTVVVSPARSERGLDFIL